MTDSTVDALRSAKGASTVAVCIPARDEATTVGAIVAAARQSPLVDEVLVVDDGSTDGTAAEATAAGARVVTGDGAGKGRAMWRALAATDADLVVFCDADLDSFDDGYVAKLVAPLLLDERIMFVKATYERFLDGRPGEGGRVNELLARPALRVLFPELAWVRQPLGGECAGRRVALQAIPFVEGWGVDIALVIDMADRFGPAGIAQADLGERRHRNRTLAELAPQAEAVLRTVLARAGVAPAVPECPPIDDGVTPRSARSA